MKILYVTYSQIGDRSFGGAMRATAIRDALIAVADVDTLVVDGGATFALDHEWSSDRVRRAVISHYGYKPQGRAQRGKLRRWVSDVIATGAYDVIVAQRLDLATLVPLAARSRMIFDPDDFVKSATAGAPASLRFKFMLRNWMARRIARQAAHVWFSNPDPRFLPPTERRSFLPNVVHVPDAQRSRSAVVPDRLLMVGLFSHRPNAEGLTWFHDHVLPRLCERRPDIRLHAIGRVDQSVRDRLRGVEFRGFVDDLTSEYDRAAVVIAPVFSGGGTQIKVIDALAHGRPLVASSFAHRGFAADLHAGDHLAVAETADDWVKLCLWALSERDAAAAMAQRGEQIVRASYGPNRLVAMVRATLDALRTL